MDISYILPSFKTDEGYYSILEDKIISKVDWEKKDTEEKEYCYVDFGIWTLFFKNSWLVSLVDQRIVEEATQPPFGIIYTVETRDEGLMSFYDYGEAFTCAAIEEYYSDVNPTYTAKEYMKKQEERNPFGRFEVVHQTITAFEDLDLYFAFDDKQKFKLVLKLLRYYWIERNNLSFGFSYIYISYPW